MDLCNPARMSLSAHPAPSPDSAKNVASRFQDPAFLKSWGYDAMVVPGQFPGVPTYDSVIPGLLPEGSPERTWAIQRAAEIDAAIKATKAAGVLAMAMSDLMVFPQALVDHFHDQICDDQNRIDIRFPKTQELMQAQMRELFSRFPLLDGIIFRTGEVYLQSYPYHTASGVKDGAVMHGNTAITHADQSHIALVKTLRAVICEELGKRMVYRTWDFGFLHTHPDYYLKVTQAVEPHPQLFFSIKHQAGDFHQLTPFNPTLGIGDHAQIVEVQCQREAYGKGAHPYYIGQGVLDGWEEYAWLMKPGEIKGLRDLRRTKVFKGVWTWSRGGGWEGPFIPNEFWCALNAFILSRFAEQPAQDEPKIFNEYMDSIGLRGKDRGRFRELCLLSEKAVLRGQLTCLGAYVYEWWARDHYLSAPDLGDFIKKGLVSQAIAEKGEAVSMWKRIEELGHEIHFNDQTTESYVRISCTYGRIKYAIIAEGWTILLNGRLHDQGMPADLNQLREAIKQYDALWLEWRALEASSPLCPSLYRDLAFGDGPGMGAAVNRYRSV